MDKHFWSGTLQNYLGTIFASITVFIVAVVVSWRPKIMQLSGLPLFLMLIGAYLLCLSAYLYLMHRRGINKHDKLVIHSATYGTGPIDDQDVTDKLRGFAKDALAISVDNNSLGCDPAPMKPKRLEVKYSYNGPSILGVSRLEGGHLVLPEDSEIARLQAELEIARRGAPPSTALAVSNPLQKKLIQPQSNSENLQERVTSLVHGLLGFLQENGPEPDIPVNTSMTVEEILEAGEPEHGQWIDKIHYGYSAKLKDRVEKITYELRAEGLSDHELDVCVSPQVQTDEKIRKLADRLLQLRDKLEMRKYEASSKGKPDEGARRKKIRLVLGDLMAEGKEMTRDLSVPVSPQIDNSARKWIAEVESELRTHLDESYVHRFRIVGSRVQIPKNDLIQWWEIQGRVEKLEEFISELR